MDNQIVYAVTKYLEKTGYKYDKEELSLQLITHSSFPNLIAISDLLNYLDISHTALSMDNSIDNLNNLPDFFLAHINEKDNPKLVFVVRKEKNIIIYSDQKKKEKILISTFLKIWSGVVIAVEEHSIKSNNTKPNFEKFLIWGSYIFIASLFAFIIWINSSLFDSLFFLISTIGLIISSFIVYHELGLKSNSLNNFCNSSEYTSCNAVINSNGATFFGIKLSDVGLIYFATQTLFTLLNLTFLNIQNIFIYPTLLSIPFIIYSVYYQWKIIKKWCPLCLMIVMVLLLQLLLIIFSNLIFFIPSIKTLIITYFILVGSIILWSYTKPFLKAKKEAETTKHIYLKLKKDFSVFKTFLLQTPAISEYKPKQEEIVFGNPKANLKITVITNPLCGHCKDAHLTIETLLRIYKDQIHITVLFNVNYSQTESLPVIVSKILLKIFNSKGETECLNAFEAVYKTENKKEWTKSNHLVLNDDYLDQVLIKQKTWCINNNLQFTPSVILNNRLFPLKQYKVKELLFFIDDIISIFNKPSN